MATVAAASASLSDVQSAVNSASSGDTVTVPSGSATWGSTITLDKRLSIIGAGIGSTIITVGGSTAFDLVSTNSRVSAMEFRSSVDSAHIVVRGGDAWRVDHCKFVDTSSSITEGILLQCGTGALPTGLIDNCYFDECRIYMVGSSDMDWQHAVWYASLGLGTFNCTYVEDCYFTGGDRAIINAIDTYNAGRYVARYNTFVNTYIETHSIKSEQRGVRSVEIYNNSFSNDGVAWYIPMRIRAGTGVIYNNTMTGTWGVNAIALDYPRYCDSYPTCGKCDGSSPWDENTPGQNGYLGRDQPGTGGDDALWTSGSPYPSQSHVPYYGWNNTYDLAVYETCSPANTNGIVEDRDFYNGTAKPGYSAYTYPHPLQGGGGTGGGKTSTTVRMA